MRLPVLALLICAFAAPPAVAAQHLYFTTASGDFVRAFDVGADGSLAGNGGTIPINDPVPVIPSPDGKYVYVAGADNSIRIFAVTATGGLGAETSAPVANVTPVGMAISPDGAHLYLLNGSTNSGTIFDVAADGGLSNGRNFATGTGPAAIALTPDGAHAYVPNALAGTITEYSVGAGGDLTTIGTTTVAQPTIPSVSADSRHLYVGHQTNGSVRIFDIQDDGSLAPNAIPSVQAGAGVWHVLVSPTRPQLFAGDSGASTGLYGWTIGDDGALTAMPGSPFSGTGVTGGLAFTADGGFLYAARTAFPVIRGYTVPDSEATQTSSTASGAEGHPFSLAMSPDQAPDAALSVSPQSAGSATGFDASATVDVDGTVTRYDWVFGDGSTATTTSPTTTHTYASAGTYDASVTAVDDLGCSTARTYNGQYVQCNGDSGARATKTLAIAAPASTTPSGDTPPAATTPAVAPILSGLAVAPRCARRRAVAAGKGHVFSYRLNVAATVRYVITRRDHSPKWPACPRPGGATPDTYSEVGSGDVSASAGEQSTPLASISRTIRSRRKTRAGRVRIPLARIAQAASKLGYGTYVLTVTATAGGLTSDDSSVRFWVLADRAGGQ